MKYSRAKQEIRDIIERRMSHSERIAALNYVTIREHSGRGYMYRMTDFPQIREICKDFTIYDLYESIRNDVFSPYHEFFYISEYDFGKIRIISCDDVRHALIWDPYELAVFAIENECSFGRQDILGIVSDIDADMEDDM